MLDYVRLTINITLNYGINASGEIGTLWTADTFWVNTPWPWDTITADTLWALPRGPRETINLVPSTKSCHYIVMY